MSIIPQTLPMNTPYHVGVPRMLNTNLRWRLRMHMECERNAESRQALYDACREDILFFVNVFAWTLDPRKLTSNSSFAGACTPFLTWEYQQDALLKMNGCLERGEDLLVEKSRDMGASWLICVWFLWRWLFHENNSFLMVSRKESLVDGDDDSLFSHIDFVMDRLPKWMIPEKSYTRTKLFLKNHRTGSVIEGESTTDNIGRGGRRTAILLDEFPAFEGGGYQALSATADTTNCRIMNGTPKGTANAFYAQRQKGTTRVRMHWSRHPEKRRGLYRVLGNGQFEKLDQRFDYTGYKFVDEVPRSEEGLRSEWYDRECARRAHAWEIAQELDIDYQGSNYPFFDPRMMETLMAEFCKAPKFVGEIFAEDRYGEEVFVFKEDPRGTVKLWCDLEMAPSLGILRPSQGRDYVMGSDISHGTGASDSATTVLDLLSGCKVAEMVHNRWGINEFAKRNERLGRFFSSGSSPAFHIWEATGPGRTYGQVVINELKYPNVYYMKDEDKLRAHFTGKFGWFASKEAKLALLTNYRMLLADRVFINPSIEAMREAGFYVFEGGSVTWAGPSGGNDPSTQGANHGDRVTGDALCAKILFERQGGGKKIKEFEAIADPPILSVAWRRKHWADVKPDDMMVVVDQEN